MEPEEKLRQSKVFKDVVKSIGSLSLAELGELVEELRLQWGVTSTGLVPIMAISAGPASSDPDDASTQMEKMFRELVTEWQDETGHISTANRRYVHPAYIRIISLGRQIIPLLLREIESNPDYWFHALRVITNGEDPGKGLRGFDEVAQSWINWGRERGELNE